jgi:hypothetical protein
MAVVGLLPLLAGPSALDATTISGTMVVGLGPPIWALTFLQGYRPLVFHLPFWTGVAFGIVMQLSTSPCCAGAMNVAGLAIGKGHYAGLLGFNVASTVCCWGLGALALLDNRQGRNLEGRGGGDIPQDILTGGEGPLVVKPSGEGGEGGSAAVKEVWSGVAGVAGVADPAVHGGAAVEPRAVTGGEAA